MSESLYERSEFNEVVASISRCSVYLSGIRSVFIYLVIRYVSGYVSNLIVEEIKNLTVVKVVR